MKTKSRESSHSSRLIFEVFINDSLIYSVISSRCEIKDFFYYSISDFHTSTFQEEVRFLYFYKELETDHKCSDG